MKIAFFSLLFLIAVSLQAQEVADTLDVQQTDDFTIDGQGLNAKWYAASWVPLTQLDEGVTGYTTRFKILYSKTGIYVLFQGLDKKITSTYKKDFDDLYNADVFEVFFHPRPDRALYFEYEINAYDKELVLLIPNHNGKIMGWRPWHYEGDKLVKHKVSIDKQKDGTLNKWTAECFFPYKLLDPLENVPPVPGMIWNANFCRLDYDPGKMIKWSWSPIKVTFHEYARFRAIRFR